MASGKRQTSKQKRASQNRAQRAALAARREAASAPASERAARAGSAGQQRGLLGRIFGAGGAGMRGRAGRAGQPVGYRAALSALLMALAGVLFCFTFSVPVDADDDPFTRESLTATWAGTALDAAAEDPSADASELAESIEDWAPGRGETPIAVALWPFSLSLALQVIGAGLGLRAVVKRSRSRAVSRALFATLFGSLLSQIPIFFLPSVIALGVAMFQIRKYESTVAAAARPTADSDDADVIETDIVEDDDADVVEADIVEDEIVEDDDAEILEDDDAEILEDDDDIVEADRDRR